MTKCKALTGLAAKGLITVVRFCYYTSRCRHLF